MAVVLCWILNMSRGWGCWVLVWFRPNAQEICVGMLHNVILLWCCWWRSLLIRSVSIRYVVDTSSSASIKHALLSSVGGEVFWFSCAITSWALTLAAASAILSTISSNSFSISWFVSRLDHQYVVVGTSESVRQGQYVNVSTLEFCGCCPVMTSWREQILQDIAKVAERRKCRISFF